MFILGFALVLASCIYGVFRLSTRVPRHPVGWLGVWRLASLIAALRICALWFGIAGLRSPGWLQSAAYLVLMLDVPEIALVRSARAEPLRWGMFGSVILATTSVAWAWAFFWVSNQLLKREAAVGRPKQD